MSNLVDKNFTKWSADEVAKYIQSKDQLGSYAELFQKHKIDGSVAHRLTDSDLKEMGVFAIGDRHRIRLALEDLHKAKDQQDREKVLWKGEEVLYWTCWDKCAKTGCGICVDDSEKYTLKSNFLEVNRPDINRAACAKCCFGHSYELITVDLSNVSNVTLEGVPPPCFQECLCCAKSQEHVKVNMSNPESRYMLLKVRKGDGQEVSRMITNQVEVMQRMERS